MGFFKKEKKKNAVIVKTITQVLDKEIKEENEKIEKYQKLIPILHKFVSEYKRYFNGYAHIYGDSVQLQFKKDYHEYPDGFFALADKLGLNVEPCCDNGGWGYSINTEYHRSFNVKAKSK